MSPHETTNLKSGIIMLRLLLLLIVFSLCSAILPVFAVNNIDFRNNRSQIFRPHIPDRDLKSRVVYSAIPETKFAPPVIDLTVQPSLSRFALISWTALPLPTQGTFSIERHDPTSPWSKIKQLPYNAPMVYIDTISYPYCAITNFEYRVRYTSAAGTDDATSLTKSVLLSDLTSPANVKDLMVNLVQTPVGFYPRLTWNPITNDSISSYEIGRFNGSAWPVVNNATADSAGFTDNVSNVCDNVFKYIIVTIDRCNNRSAPDYDSLVQTIRLTIKQPANCDRTARLLWSSYKSMPGGIGGYTICRDEASSTSVKFDSKDTSYVDNSSLVNGHEYLYSIKAYSKNGINSSSSCQVPFKYNAALIPDVYIPQVTVEADSYNWVSYNFSPPNTVIKLILERSDNGTSDFRPIDSLQGSGIYYLPTSYYFNDTTAHVHKQSYYYRLVAYDDCGGKTYSSNISRSIFLQGTSQQTQNTLTWNSYQTWTQGVESYKVYRILDGDNSSVEMISQLPPSTNTFSDLLTGVDPSKSVCYWVVANETSSFAISKSNTFCIIKEPVLFMPNAFNPDSDNKLFRPVPQPLFIDPQSFKMIIFSRWGQQIFETTDMQNGWDGTINGQMAPIGLYTYFLKYKSQDGKEYSKRGTATLIR